jgi:Reverse transcriptase (RNA-dependent DNA polymerase)
MPLPRRFLSLHNFDLAFTRLVRSGNKEYKQFYRHLFPSYNLALAENLKDLIEDIRRGTFRPDPVTIIYQPKKSGILRPLTLLSLRDLIVYQALVNFLAEGFETTQERYALKQSFGAVFAGKSSLFFYRSWKTCYASYNEAITKAYKAGNTFVADFDLVSFYELIDHELLRSRLAKKVRNIEFLDLLFQCLRGWTNRASGSHMGHGVPQGPEPSAFIAECFLFDFDKLTFPETKYFRYIDDIKLMSKDEVPIRRALVRLDLASKRLGLVPQAQKIECRRVRSLKEVLKTIPSPLAQAGTDATKKKTTQKKVLSAFQQSLRKQGTLWIIDDLTKFKYALNRLMPRRDVLRRIAPFLSRHPELSWVLSNYLKKFPKDVRAADVLLQALRRNPTYDSAAGNYIDAMDVCEPPANHKNYRRVIHTARGRSEEKSILLPIAASSFRGKRMAIPQAIRLIESQRDATVRGILIHRLFGDNPAAPFQTSKCDDLLKKLTECDNPDLARYAASLLLGHWPWFTKKTWRPSRSAHRSVALLVTGLGLRRRAPKRKSVLEMYFHEQWKIYMSINWRKALGRDLRAIEQKCLRLQQLMIGDPSARVMILDTFNESLIQAFSTRHATLAAPYSACVRPGKTVPDYGAWLYHGNALLGVLPRATLWLRDVHKLRVKADLAHAKDQKTGVHTRPISFREADAFFKRAQLSWAELIREWIKIL